MTARAWRRAFFFGGAAGALAMLFMDPVAGRRRRHLAVDRAAGTMRRGWRRLQRLRRAVVADAYGIGKKIEHRREEPKRFDDATLADKVQSEIFRHPDVPKGQINVNVQEGVVQLRGEVPTADMLEELVGRARRVQGVRDVESLLHLPGTPAPMHS